MNNKLGSDFHQLDKLNDPDYFGILVAKYFLYIIAVLLLILLGTAFVTTSLIDINVTVKSNTARSERCASTSSTCVQLALPETAIGKVAVGNIAHIKVSSQQTYSRHMLEGTVTRIYSAVDTRQDNPHLVEVELASEPYKKDGIETHSGFIVVGKQSLLSMLIHNLFPNTKSGATQQNTAPKP